MSQVYDMVVVGGGAAGLTAAGFAGRLGAKVALVERERLGGDCTWYGCIPSKALLKVAKVAHSMRTSARYGIEPGEPVINMARVREYVQETIQDVYQYETPELYSADYGVEVVIGEAHFVNTHTVRVGDRFIEAKKFVIATGAGPDIPPIAGLETVAFKTNLNIFDSDRLPGRMIVVGAGPIGIEMAQAHARLGAEVTVIDIAVLPRDEPEAGALIQKVLQKEGVRFESDLVNSVRQEGDEIIVTLRNGKEIRADDILIATGRRPNVAKLGLETIGLQFSRDGIPVNDHMQTNLEHIYAVGDCTTGPKFTHLAGAQGSIAARNALIPLMKANGHDPNLPWVTFSDPEVAHAGLTEAEARQKFGPKVKVFHFPIAKGDRAVADGATDGFIKLVYKGRGQILGATIVAERAGEMIVEYSYAMSKGFGISKIVATTHAYPTYSDIVRKAAANLLTQELLGGFSGKLLGVVSRLLFRR